MNFTEFKKTTEFYFEIQYFNFDWKITITFLTVTETLNNDKYVWRYCHSGKNAAI